MNPAPIKEAPPKTVSIKSSPNASHIAETNHVLLGRGRGCAQNPGNRRMRRIINIYKDQYISSSKAEKRKLLKKVHDEIAEGGVMFLKQVGNGNEWVEVEAEVAIDKVAHSLRCRKDRKDNIQESTAKSIVGSSVPKNEWPQEILAHQEILSQQHQIPSAAVAHQLEGEVLRHAIASAPKNIPTSDSMNNRPEWSLAHQEILSQQHQIPTAAAAHQLVEDEVLRHTIVQQQTRDLDSLQTRAMLVQQLRTERLKTNALIQSLTSSMQPPSPAASIPELLQSPQTTIEQGQTLRRIMASRGNMMFPGGF